MHENLMKCVPSYDDFPNGTPTWYWPLVLHILKRLLESPVKRMKFEKLVEEFDWVSVTSHEPLKQTKTRFIKIAMACIANHVVDIQILSTVPHPGGAAAKDITSDKSKIKPAQLRLQFIKESSYDIKELQRCL